jgi:hypothetical protein
MGFSESLMRISLRLILARAVFASQRPSNEIRDMRCRRNRLAAHEFSCARDHSGLKDFSRKSRTKNVARDTASIAHDLMLAPMVAFMRLPVMASEARSSSWGTETVRAVSEKTVAMAEGMFAAQMSYLQSASSFWPELISGKTPSMFNGVAAERSISAALKPSSRRVKANYRRLMAKN